jgi:hypothetical protein
VKDWVTAYAHRGAGSTYDRARDIDGIYDIAAPIPDEAGNENASKLVAEISGVVKSAVLDAGGKFQ